MNIEKKSDALIKSECATVALSDLSDETVIRDTIAKVEKGVLVASECIAYLREAKTRFDNRGRGTRMIDGWNGWRDFVENGLGKSLRTVQRQILESVEPDRILERLEKGRLKLKQEDTWCNRLDRSEAYHSCKDRVFAELVYEQARLGDAYINGGGFENMQEAAALESQILGHIYRVADNRGENGHSKTCFCSSCMFTGSVYDE